MADGVDLLSTDSMSLAYEGNRIVSVSDEGRHLLGADLFGFSDGADALVEYEYDENGNTVKDLNRKISSIQYNSLNLPSKVTLTDGSYARYDYDAAGRKLKSYYHIGEDIVVGPGLDPVPFPSGLSGGDGLMSVVGESQIAYLRDSIEYCGNVLYDNGHLDKVFVDGGYATLNATTGQPTFHFYVRDHLGSIRRIVRQDGVVERTNHYYPYGGLHSESTGTTAHRFRFSGKEYDPMLGLNSYDFSARWQMPDLTRFGQIDPLAEKYYSWSPYAYCAGNPVRYVDPDGRVIRVEEKYQSFFFQALRGVFGDSSKDFSFEEDNSLVYKGNKNSLSKLQKKVLSKLEKLMESTEITEVIYEKEITIPEGNGIFVDTESYGGEATVLRNEAGTSKNYVVVDPNGPSQVDVMEVTSDYYINKGNSSFIPGTINLILNKIETNMVLNTWHGLGHVIYSGKRQHNVIRYENFVRTIMGKSLRKADERHNKTVTKGDSSIWEK